MLPTFYAASEIAPAQGTESREAAQARRRPGTHSLGRRPARGVPRATRPPAAAGSHYGWAEQPSGPAGDPPTCPRTTVVTAGGRPGVQTAARGERDHWLPRRPARSVVSGVSDVC